MLPAPAAAFDEALGFTSLGELTRRPAAASPFAPASVTPAAEDDRRLGAACAEERRRGEGERVGLLFLLGCGCGGLAVDPAAAGSGAAAVSPRGEAVLTSLGEDALLRLEERGRGKAGASETAAAAAGSDVADAPSRGEGAFVFAPAPGEDAPRGDSSRRGDDDAGAGGSANCCCGASAAGAAPAAAESRLCLPCVETRAVLGRGEEAGGSCVTLPPRRAPSSDATEVACDSRGDAAALACFRPLTAFLPLVAVAGVAAAACAASSPPSLLLTAAARSDGLLVLLFFAEDFRGTPARSAPAAAAAASPRCCRMISAGSPPPPNVRLSSASSRFASPPTPPSPGAARPEMIRCAASRSARVATWPASPRYCALARTTSAHSASPPVRPLAS